MPETSRVRDFACKSCARQCNEGCPCRVCHKKLSSSDSSSTRQRAKSDSQKAHQPSANSSSTLSRMSKLSIDDSSSTHRQDKSGSRTHHQDHSASRAPRRDQSASRSSRNPRNRPASGAMETQSRGRTTSRALASEARQSSRIEQPERGMRLVPRPNDSEQAGQPIPRPDHVPRELLLVLGSGRYDANETNSRLTSAAGTAHHSRRERDPSVTRSSVRSESHGRHPTLSTSGSKGSRVSHSPQRNLAQPSANRSGGHTGHPHGRRSSSLSARDDGHQKQSSSRHHEQRDARATSQSRTHGHTGHANAVVSERRHSDTRTTKESSHHARRSSRAPSDSHYTSKTSHSGSKGHSSKVQGSGQLPSRPRRPSSNSRHSSSDYAKSESSRFGHPLHRVR